MTHKPSRIILISISLLFISQLPIFPTNAQHTLPTQPTLISQNPDLLIILSPQYGHDTEIRTAITSYITAVKNDLGWNSTLLTIHQNENTYQAIDKIIETTYTTHPLRACIMVGEDLNTPLGGDCDYLEQPSTLPWSTIGHNTSYQNTDQGIVCTPTTHQLCISLLYPTHDLSYDQKKSQLITAFHKFTTHRKNTLATTIKVFESSDLNTNSKTLYQSLNTTGKLTYTEDATDADLLTSYHTPSDLYFVHGHSNPAGTDISTQKNSGWFSAETLDNLQTPFFGADGCYVAGWWSTHTDNNHLDPSINATWYGSHIFTSPTIQVMALGLLSQNGFTQPISFIENVIPQLLSGKTLAESMIGDLTIGDTVIVGDPTFHFTL
jgi:hypothetical protein